MRRSMMVLIAFMSLGGALIPVFCVSVSSPWWLSFFFLSIPFLTSWVVFMVAAIQSPSQKVKTDE